MQERRKGPRLLVREIGLASKLRHALLSTFGSSCPGNWDPIVDLSAKGACFLTDRDLKREQKVGVTLRIATQIPPVELVGRVAWVAEDEASQQYRVGVQFTDYREEAWPILSEFEQQYARQARRKREQGSSPESLPPPDPTGDECSAERLHEAASDNAVDQVRAFLDQGADPSATNKWGQTPLHLAAKAGHAAVAKQLLDQGAHVDAKDDLGCTPLHGVGSAEVAELLLAGAAYVNAKDSFGYTPLVDASMDGNVEVVKLLLTNGAEVNVVDGAGYTPILWAVASGKMEIADILRKHGANG